MTTVSVHFAPSLLALYVVILITLHEIAPGLGRTITIGAMVREVREDTAMVKFKVKIKVKGKVKGTQGGGIVDPGAEDSPTQSVPKVQRVQRAPRVARVPRDK